jgi:rSAM/selenodomain-associated transferase 1
MARDVQPMKCQLVIFARAPQPGRVKRRLAGEIGPIAAARFYRAVLTEEIRRLSRDRRWTVWLFVTPDDAIGHAAWRGLVPRSRLCRQGQGDLGQRMKLPFRLLPPGPAVLVGSDIPAMRASHIAAAFRLLGRHDLVFGPANDGGFWLIGARRTKPMPHRLFAGVEWSTPRTLKDTLAGIPAQFSIGFADTLDDVDSARDLRRFQGEQRGAPAAAT